MNSTRRPPLGWVIMGLLAALVATNVVLLALLRTGGPLIGGAFYTCLLVLAWRRRRRGHRSSMVGGLVGLAVHIVEVALAGWSAYPAWMALNLALPAALAVTAWRTDRHVQ
jgi:hypothetical protein